MIGGPITCWPLLIHLVELGGVLRPPAGMLVWGGALLMLLAVTRAARRRRYQRPALSANAPRV